MKTITKELFQDFFQEANNVRGQVLIRRKGDCGGIESHYARVINDFFEGSEGICIVGPYDIGIPLSMIGEVIIRENRTVWKEG